MRNPIKEFLTFMDPNSPQNNQNSFILGFIKLMAAIYIGVFFFEIFHSFEKNLASRIQKHKK